MKQFLFPLLSLLFFAYDANAQQFEGMWRGKLDTNDPVSLFLKHKGEGRYSGNMNDNANNYVVTAVETNDRLSGDCYEEELDLKLGLEATRRGNQMILTLIYMGDEVVLTMNYEDIPASYSYEQPSAPIRPRQTDFMLTGRWERIEDEARERRTEEDDNEAQEKQPYRLWFVGDGSMRELGEPDPDSISVFEESTPEKIEGLRWYTRNKKIYLEFRKGSESNNIFLGSYFIDNDKLVIIADDGTRELYRRL